MAPSEQRTFDVNINMQTQSDHKAGWPEEHTTWKADSTGIFFLESDSYYPPLHRNRCGSDAEEKHASSMKQQLPHSRTQAHRDKDLYLQHAGGRDTLQTSGSHRRGGVTACTTSPCPSWRGSMPRSSHWGLWRDQWVLIWHQDGFLVIFLLQLFVL